MRNQNSVDRVALPEGYALDRYEILSVLGMGGFGITYKVMDHSKGQHFALKEYFPSEFATRTSKYSIVPNSTHLEKDFAWGLSRFMREAETLSTINHPHITRVDRRFPANNTAYIVLEFESGRSLQIWVGELGRYPKQEELDTILVPILDALWLLHRQNLYHRDIAPDNIIYRFEGGPVLIDFGAARYDLGRHSQRMSSVVKSGFSPIEQYSTNTASQGPWSDIYALSATLYYLMAGLAPQEATGRVVGDKLVLPSRFFAGRYRMDFLQGLDAGLAVRPEHRPPHIEYWASMLGLMPAWHQFRVRPSSARRAGIGAAAGEGAQAGGGNPNRADRAPDVQIAGAADLGGSGQDADGAANRAAQKPGSGAGPKSRPLSRTPKASQALRRPSETNSRVVRRRPRSRARFVLGAVLMLVALAGLSGLGYLMFATDMLQ